jgi:hypothetical protein
MKHGIIDGTRIKGLCSKLGAQCLFCAVGLICPTRLLNSSKAFSSLGCKISFFFYGDFFFLITFNEPETGNIPSGGPIHSTARGERVKWLLLRLAYARARISLNSIILSL